MEYIVYILFSKIKDRYYIGYTGDNIKECIRKHHSNHKGFTGGAGNWQLLYYETHLTKADAIKREKAIKNWKSRKMVEQLIGV